jgi:large-conductance mechanosensitive channel
MWRYEMTERQYRKSDKLAVILYEIAVIYLIIATAIYMIVTGTKKLKELKTEVENEK